jgi:hypothetical protein
LATKRIYLFEYLLWEGAFHISEVVSTLLLWGVLFIILITLLSFAFSIPAGCEAEYHDSFLMEEGHLGWNMGYFPRQSYQPSFLSSIFALLLFHQYLRSHIGEKRLDDSSSKLTSSVFGVSTALFYSAVFYLWARVVAGPSWVTQIIDQRRTMVVHEFFQSGLLEHKLLVRGGLQPCVE